MPFCDGYDLRAVPLAERRALLQSILTKPRRAADTPRSAIEGSKEGNLFFASVYVYSEDENAGMRLFLADGGKTGFALKGDNIVSVSASGSAAGRQAPG
jgi:hypothetical protein